MVNSREYLRTASNCVDTTIANPDEEFEYGQNGSAVAPYYLEELDLSQTAHVAATFTTFTPFPPFPIIPAVFRHLIGTISGYLRNTVG